MYGTYTRLRVPVGASNMQVIRAASRKIGKSKRFARACRKQRHAFYKQMLAYHINAKALVRDWRL